LRFFGACGILHLLWHPNATANTRNENLESEL